MNTRRNFRNFLIDRYGTPSSLQNVMQYAEQMLCGHREVLIKYMDLQEDTYFEAVIPQGKILPHGIEPIEVFKDRNGSALLQLLWRSDAEEEAKRFGINNVVSIGATGLYALHNLGISIDTCRSNIAKVAATHSWGESKIDLLDKFANKNILYMPTHSWTGARAQHNAEDFEFLTALDKRNVRICLGYLDYCDPNVRKKYLQFGWEIVCAGVKDSLEFPSPSGGRAGFLYELFEILNWSDIVLADELTTGQFYAVCLAKDIGLMPKILEENVEHMNGIGKRDFLLNHQIRTTYPWLTGASYTEKKMIKDVEDALGLNKFKNPIELSKIVPWHRESILSKTSG